MKIFVIYVTGLWIINIQFNKDKRKLKLFASTFERKI